MNSTSRVLVLIGEKTKNLYRYVRWELELALEKHLPIVAANLNDSRYQDERCPAIIRDKCVSHVPFKMKAIKHALDSWPTRYRGLSAAELTKGWRYYSNDVYAKLGI
jgi:hypothetical protein